MTDAIFPEFAAALGERAEQLIADPAVRRRRRRGLRGPIMVLAATASLGGGAYAAHAVWSPQLGDERRGHATASASSVPDRQLQHLAVLRRAQTEADRGWASRYALKFQGHESRGVRTDAVRLLSRGSEGRSVVLIPIKEWGHPDGPIREALCLWIRDPVDGGGLTCGTTDDLLTRGLTLSMIPPPKMTADQRDAAAARMRRAISEARRAGRSYVTGPVDLGTPQRGQTVGLVPDGVAQVRFAAAGGQPAVTVPVRANVYVAHLFESQISAEQRWLDARGDPVRFPVLRSVPPQIPLPPWVFDLARDRGSR